MRVCVLKTGFFVGFSMSLGAQKVFLIGHQLYSELTQSFSLSFFSFSYGHIYTFLFEQKKLVPSRKFKLRAVMLV